MTDTTTTTSSSNLSRSLFGSITKTAQKQSRLNSKWTRLAFYLVLLRSLIVITLQLIVALLFTQHVGHYTSSDDIALDIIKRSKNIIVYHYTFIIAHLYLIVAWWDALYRQNVIQVGALLLLEYCCIGYTIFQVQSHQDLLVISQQLPGNYYTDIDSSLWEQLAIVVLSILSVFVLTMLTIKLYRDLGWQVYKRLGANIQHRRMYLSHQILLTLLKLDVFFFMTLAAQFLTLVIMDGETFPWTILFIVVPASVMSVALAYLSLQRENAVGMAIFLASLVTAVGYLVYKLVRVVQTVHADPDPYTYSRTVLLIFIGTNLALFMLTAVYALLCTSNFGHGLLLARKRFQELQQQQQLDLKQVDSLTQLEKAHLVSPNRFELD